jgi:hypothetical protein
MNTQKVLKELKKLVANYQAKRVRVGLFRVSGLESSMMALPLEMAVKEMISKAVHLNQDHKVKLKIPKILKQFNKKNQPKRKGSFFRWLFWPVSILVAYIAYVIFLEPALSKLLGFKIPGAGAISWILEKVLVQILPLVLELGLLMLKQVLPVMAVYALIRLLSGRNWGRQRILLIIAFFISFGYLSRQFMIAEWSDFANLKHIPGTVAQLYILIHWFLPQTFGLRRVPDLIIGGATGFLLGASTGLLPGGIDNAALSVGTMVLFGGLAIIADFEEGFFDKVQRA